MGFKIIAFDGTTFEIPDREYYFNTKARGRRMMGNSLSSDARRVYACLELATMGWQQELAVTMEGGKQRPLTPADIQQQTGLSKQNARRGLVELEDAGLAQRKARDGGTALLKGQVLLYSWAVPRKPKEEFGSRARLPFPDWFPQSWEPLKPLISRFKYSLIQDEAVARDYLEEGAEVARAYQEAEMAAARFLERVRAGRKSAPASLYRKNGNNIERTSSSSAVEVSRADGENRKDGANTAEEEDGALYPKFKASYPAAHFDEAKAKPTFEKKTQTQQAHIIERLDVYLSCERWQDEAGRWIPLASNWLQSCDMDPPPVLKKNGAPAKKGYVESLREEAERRIAKFGRI